MATAKQQVIDAGQATPSAGKLRRDRRLSDQVYEKILEMISNGETPVGSKLPSENVLCDRLAVSRPVVRQALKQLRENGVVVSRQGSGSYVQRRAETGALDFAPVGSIADIQRTFEFRAAIEGEAAFLAATRRTDTDLGKMREALTELDQVIIEGSLGVDADEAFHETICAASGNPYFTTARTSMQANILTGLNLTRNLSLTKPQERLELVQIEHHKIFAAIEQRDAEGARDAMRAHVENARKRIFEG